MKIKSSSLIKLSLALAMILPLSAWAGGPGCGSWAPNGQSQVFQSVIRALGGLRRIGYCKLKRSQFSDDCSGTYIQTDVSAKNISTTYPDYGRINLSLDLNHNDSDAWQDLAHSGQIGVSGDDVTISQNVGYAWRAERTVYIKFAGFGQDTKITDIGISSSFGNFSCISGQ